MNEEIEYDINTTYGRYCEVNPDGSKIEAIRIGDGNTMFSGCIYGDNADVGLVMTRKDEKLLVIRFSNTESIDAMVSMLEILKSKSQS
jgi:hypothetical protein